jgi:uncharacterized protein
MTLTANQIESIRQCLAALCPAAVYLFGSAATGRLRLDSDLDLAILPISGAIMPLVLFETRNLLAEKLESDVDLIDLARATTVFRKEVLRTGVLLFENDLRRRHDFEMYALSDYARLNEERAPVLAALAQSLVAHA